MAGSLEPFFFPPDDPFAKQLKAAHGHVEVVAGGTAYQLDVQSAHTLPSNMKWVGATMAGVGCLSLLAYSINAGSVLTAATVFVFAGSVCFLGALLGLVFGIPRALQHTYVTAPTDGTADQAAADGHGLLDYAQNTNLEQISDWLTKIIVGIGLTQFPSIARGCLAIATYFAQNVDGRAQAAPFWLASLLYWLSLAFIWAYAFARLYLLRYLQQADAKARAVSSLNKVTEDHVPPARANQLGPSG